MVLHERRAVLRSELCCERRAELRAVQAVRAVRAVRAGARYEPYEPSEMRCEPCRPCERSINQEPSFGTRFFMLHDVYTDVR